MANLPPRPESPPRIRDDRRYTVDDRERRPAQPMASRFRGDRYPDERMYVPRPRPDTYIAPGFEPRREIEGRRVEYDDRDRDRHRSFDRDRDRRNWGNERDGGPRRWESGPDRDRRPHERDRGSNRPLSPQRRPVSRRFSRSPPRRRPPSPPYRSRPRSRSHSPRHSPPPSKRLRLGDHPRVATSRSRSPHHQRPSHDRSRSRSRVHPENEVRNSKNKSRATSLDNIKVEPSDAFPISDASMLEDRKQLSELHISEIDMKAPLNPPDTWTLSQIVRTPKLSPSQDDIKPEIKMASPVPQTLEVSPTDDQKLTENFESASHKPSPQSPIQARRSPTPPRPPRNMHENTPRVPPTGPQRNWVSRSPPRGPRSHPRQPIPPGPAPSYISAPRGPRRGFPPTGPSSSFSNPASTASRHNPESKKNSKYPDPDLDIYRAQANRSHLAFDYLQRGKSLRRALHELDLATIDLHAAEIRRHIADVQLEKAKNGALAQSF